MTNRNISDDENPDVRNILNDPNHPYINAEFLIPHNPNLLPFVVGDKVICRVGFVYVNGQLYEGMNRTGVLRRKATYPRSWLVAINMPDTVALCWMSEEDFYLAE